MLNNKLNYRIINLAAFMLLLYISFSNIGLWLGIIAKIISVLAPFIVGFIFAYAFTPLVRWLTNKGIPKTGSLLIVIFGIIFIVGLLLFLTLPLLYDQLSLLLNMIIEVFNNISDKFNVNIGSFEIEITDYLKEILKSLSSFTSSTTVCLAI